MTLITLMTDFGPGRYVASMKAVILSINKQATVVDIEHEISPQSVLEGAFVLASAVKYFPFAIHVAVVDPGVGTERRALVAECRKGILVGPDNGLLMPAVQVLGLQGTFEITRKEYCLPQVSTTFHGRDVFAPVAAHLSLGLTPTSVGDPVEDPVELDFGEYTVLSSRLEGRILFRDRFGNLVTNIPQEALPPWISPGTTLELKLRRSHELPFVRTYWEGRPDHLLATISSDGYLEIAVNQGDASEFLGARPGEVFVLRKP